MICSKNTMPQKPRSLPPEQRQALFRRDINERPGTVAAQVIAGYLLLHHTEYIVDRWDALAILLVCMIAPELLKKMLTLKYGSTDAPTAKPVGK